MCRHCVSHLATLLWSVQLCSMVNKVGVKSRLWKNRTLPLIDIE